VYLSPWDRNNAQYGRPEYVETYRRQLRELLTGYGPIYEVWHDGANGGDGYYGGAREKRQIDRKTYYGWPETWDMVRSLQPGAVIFSDVGPDIRWVGNEDGTANEENWNVVDAYQILRWRPAEADTPLRNEHWFWHPNDEKSLKSLDGRLEMLSEWAVFQVNINSVLGSGVKNSEDALAIAHRALQLGFTSTVGIIHDHDGQLKPLVQRDQEIFEEIMTLGKRSFSRFNQFQHNVARGREHDWKCRAGSRYLYICEDGLVHWCSQQRGYPGIALANYTAEMRHREFLTHKGCAPRCTVSCVQQVGIMDNWRAPQTLQPQPVTVRKSELVRIAKGSA